MKRKIRATFWRLLYVALSVALIYANSVAKAKIRNWKLRAENLESECNFTDFWLPLTRIFE